MAGRLTLDDISDLRAYERERDVFRDRIIELKKRRRVGVGPLVTVVFENRETVRFQVQEMARAERMLTDQQIQAELDAYNPLIPGRGELIATLFVELTSRAELEEWLPKLVGIERHVQLRIGDAVVAARPDPAHAARLTRAETTASVHYIRFEGLERLIAAFAAGPADLAVDHPAYSHARPLGDGIRQSLLGDLRGSSE